MSPSPEPAAAALLPDDVATLKALLLVERTSAAELAGHDEQLGRCLIQDAGGPRPAISGRSRTGPRQSMVMRIGP